MPARWLFKTEPSEFSFDDLEKRKRATWDGVRNAAALIHLRAVKKGDLVMIYHTGDEKAVVGEAKVARGAYPDPRAHDDRLVVVDLVPGKRWRHPVTLAAVKADRRFRDLALVRISRLSVMPVADPLWDALRELGRG